MPPIAKRRSIEPKGAAGMGPEATIAAKFDRTEVGAQALPLPYRAESAQKENGNLVSGHLLLGE
jgi:hypothetical protein